MAGFSSLLKKNNKTVMMKPVSKTPQTSLIGIVMKASESSFSYNYLNFKTRALITAIWKYMVVSTMGFRKPTGSLGDSPK